MHVPKSALVISAIGGASHSYRAEQLAKAFIVNGLETRVFGSGEVDHAHNVLLQDRRCAVVALVRSPLAGPFADIVEVAQSRGIPVLADFDDLVFRADIFDQRHMDGLRYLSDDELEAYRGAVPLYRAMVAAADVCVTSTGFLATEALAAGARRSVTVPNAYTHAQAALSRGLRDERVLRPRTDMVIGYASGSMTHQSDFAEAAHSVADVLERSRAHRLRITGQLDLDDWPVLQPFRDQVDHESLRTLGEIPFVYDQYDVALAPLQLDNPFTDAKSPLKFIDATLAGVPTVASPTASYGELAAGTELLLPRTRQEWTDALNALSEDEALRVSLVKHALERVQSDFSPARHARIVGDLLGDMGATSAATVRHKPLVTERHPAASPATVEVSSSLLWVVPPPELGSGGMGSIFRIARELNRQGVSSLIMVSSTTDMGQAAHYSDEFGIEVVSEGSTVPAGARQVATHWPTAWAIAKRRNDLRPLYFIQDYEPYFYPMSYERLRAEGSYALPFHHVYYGPWVGAKVVLPPSVCSVTVDFPIDPDFLAPIDVARDPNAVAFLSRPDMPRRCYDFSVALLTAILDRRPETTVHTYGSFAVPHLQKRPQVTHHGYLSKPEMARLYRACSFGLAVSTTNPSAVPLEMMASGCVPVDLETEVAPFTYRGYETVPLLLPLELDAAVEALVSGLSDRNGTAQRRLQALDSGGSRPSPAESAAVLAAFLERLPD